MKKVFAFLIVFPILIAHAQHEADNWYFGWGAGITFSTNPPTFLPGGQIYTIEGSSSISDSNGNLLFYSDGVSVWDANHTIMPNGTGLLGSISSTQSALIVPKLGNASLYYIFTAPVATSNDPLCFSIVDMTLNGGLGDVTVLNSPMLDSSTEKLTAVRHSNGTDFWVIGHSRDDNNFCAFLVTASGVNLTPVVSSVGSIYGINDLIGCLKVSPCGDKIAAAVWSGNFLELFDFDNATGIVSNPVLLWHWSAPPYRGIYGVEFSPNSSLLYVNYGFPALLTQYNLNAGSPAAIIASCDTIFKSNDNGTFLGAPQNGPDGRIYLNSVNANYLSGIKNPNQLGSSCNFVSNYVFLDSTFDIWGLPNFLTSYFCDLSVNTPHLTSTNCITGIFPNPASNSVNIVFNTNGADNTQISILNSLGVNVYNQTVPWGAAGNEITIPLIDFQKGVYILTVENKGRLQQRKLLVN